MKTTTLIAALLLLAACATTEEERINPIKDFIEVAELPETDAIHVTVTDQPTSEAIDDQYEIVETRKQAYLIEYTRRCVDDPMLRRVKPFRRERLSLMKKERRESSRPSDSDTNLTML